MVYYRDGRDEGIAMAKRTESWTVGIVGRARKQQTKLPPLMTDAFELLLFELRSDGPIRSNWTNFGRLHKKKGEEYYHCHLNKGKPRYVAVWRVVDKTVRLMEIRYVGTHEGADYKKIN